MKAKISKIILWPKKAGKKPRVIEFKMEGVEVITGRSQTGKSSLIPIVDYCLGSDKCAIPVGEIRNAVEWFGVLVKLPKAEMLLARRNPGLQAETSEMYFDIRGRIELPDSLADLPKVNTTSVLSQLNKFAELPSLSFTGEDDAGFGGRPSFRDTAAFQFQPQHIVANPYTLFFKADTFEHQEKLKYILPFFLGAIDSETLEARRRLRTLEAELVQKRDQMEQRRQRSSTWLQEFEAFYSQAREYGLLPGTSDPSKNWAVERYVGFLASVPSQLKKNPFPAVERGASRRLARELAGMHKEEDAIAKSIADRKRKLTRVERLSASTDGYSHALTVQGERLQPVSWFSTHVSQNHSCPVCGSETENAEVEVQRLVTLAKEVAENVGTIENVNLVLDKEAATLSDDLRKLEEQANGVREGIRRLEEESEAMASHRQRLQDIYTFVGRLEQELEKFNASNRGDGLADAIAGLERSVAELRLKIDQNAINRRLETAMKSISESISYYCDILGVEHADRPAHISVKNLTVVVDGPQGRQDYLWEIGSAANWMGYHLATLLALHEHFLAVSDRSSSPVPQFLFIDQPSQAFFPERWDLRRHKRDEPAMDSDDVARVQRIFRALSAAVRRTKKRLQIVLIEHVGEAAWRGIENVHVIARWRGDDALIPADWRD